MVGIDISRDLYLSYYRPRPMKSSACAFDGVFNGVVQISCFKGMIGVVVTVLRLGDDGLLSAKKLMSQCIFQNLR